MRLHGRVEKGWGWEEIWASNDLYCAKILHFNKGAAFSMHFHAVKDETWLVMSGVFEVRWIDTETAKIHSENLVKGQVWHNKPLLPHQVVCIEEGELMEVSTADSVEDNYRVAKGDSQR